MLALAPAMASAEVSVQWLGHATTRIIDGDGRVILIDPYLSNNPKTPARYRDPETLGRVDLILVTHGHIDHFGDLVPLARTSGAPVVGPYELLRNLVAMGVLDGKQVVSLGKGGYVEPLGRGLKVHMTQAEHSSSVDLRAPHLRGTALDGLRHVAGGEPAGYVLEFADGFTLYHSGDTGLFGDMQLIGDFFEPDVALVCIGGTFTMGPESAAYAVKRLIRPKAAIPIHYGTYPVINRTPAEFVEALGETEIEVVALEPGETRVFP